MMMLFFSLEVVMRIFEVFSFIFVVFLRIFKAFLRNFEVFPFIWKLTKTSNLYGVEMASHFHFLLKPLTSCVLRDFPSKNKNKKRLFRASQSSPDSLFHHDPVDR